MKNRAKLLWSTKCAGASGMTVCVPTAITKVQTYPCSLPGFSPVPAQADTRDLPLPTHIP